MDFTVEIETYEVLEQLDIDDFISHHGADDILDECDRDEVLEWVKAQGYTFKVEEADPFDVVAKGIEEQATLHKLDALATAILAKLSPSQAGAFVGALVACRWTGV